MVSDLTPSKQLINWSKSVDLVSGYIYNFVRKAIQSQLPTFDNLHRWGRAHSNICPMCSKVQTNKHVLSNCSSSGALNRYTIRHDKILKLLVDWIAPKLDSGTQLYQDLSLPSYKQVTDLFINLRPDIAVVSPSGVGVLELTVCHESNLLSSRTYKLDKYKNISNHRFTSESVHLRGLGAWFCGY